VAALSVDHGLRPEAARECVHVGEFAASVGVPHATLRLDAPPGPANLQAEAREARYAAMAARCRGEGIDWLLTAHHANDQAETLLLRLARGSGAAGLAGIRPAACIAGLQVLRPLLGWPRSALLAALAPSGWQPAEDPSNRDPRFDRSEVRALLAREPLLDPVRLAASTAHLVEAEAALDWAAQRAWASRVTAASAGLAIDPEGLPQELRRRMLARGLVALGAAQPEGPSISRLLERLAAGGSGTLGGVSVQALPDGRWRLAPAPPRRPRPAQK
jgi:tRNA(Ile)-lysidine synthase